MQKFQKKMIKEFISIHHKKNTTLHPFRLQAVQCKVSKSPLILKISMLTINNNLANK